jgi:F-type H+-transporting ATPase subunit epsilon
MAKTFKVEIVTPEALLLSLDAESLVVPAERGQLGVLAGRAPLLCTLQPGEIRLREPGKGERYFATSGGFMEVVPGKASLLTESSEEHASIDVARAEEARKRAEERLASRAKAVDRDRARAALERARNRLQVAKKRRG